VPELTKISQDGRMVTGRRLAALVLLAAGEACAVVVSQDEGAGDTGGGVWLLFFVALLLPAFAALQGLRGTRGRRAFRLALACLVAAANLYVMFALSQQHCVQESGDEWCGFGQALAALFIGIPLAVVGVLAGLVGLVYRR
jgi:hypothetical protein